jgi:predicted nucleotidyltransferase
MSEEPASQTGFAEIVEANLPALTALCRRFGVRRLDVFGSAATGRFDPARSDLDFLVEFEQPSAGGFSGPYFGLLGALETLFQRRIDLLTDRSLENPYRRRRIEAEKRTLYRSSIVA